MAILEPYSNTREDDVFHFLNMPSVMRSTGETTRGAYGLMEHWDVPVGFASPYHVHRREDEAFYVLEGELSVICGDQWMTASAGSYVYGPRDIPHGFKVVGSGPVRMLLMWAPAGFEKMVMDMATDASAAPAPPDMGKLMAAATACGVEILGPLPEE